MSEEAERAFEGAERIPVQVWQGSFRLMGVELRCSVLDDGRRVINADDMEALFLGDHGTATPEMVTEELNAFTDWLRGASKHDQL